MPRKNLGPCTVIAIDPGTTTGVLVASIDPRWLKGFGPATWEGLGAAIRFKAGYQVGRKPRRFDIDRDRSMKIERPEGLDELMMPVLAEGQPLLEAGDGEFGGVGRRDLAFYSVLRGEGSGGPLGMLDAQEVLQVRQIAGLLSNYPEAALLIEDFNLRQLNSDREFLSSPRLRLSIQAEEILHGGGRVAWLQQPGEMHQAADDRLKRARLYFAGMEHTTDAARHAAVFFRKCRSEEALRSAAYPRHFHDWED